MSALIGKGPHRAPVHVGLHQMSMRTTDVHKLIAATAIGANEMASIVVDVGSNRSKRQLHFAIAACPHFRLLPRQGMLSMSNLAITTLICGNVLRFLLVGDAASAARANGLPWVH
jgi:hypothetical protein